MPETDIAEMRAGAEDELTEAEVILPDLATSASAKSLEPWLARWASEEPRSLFDRWRTLVREARTVLPHRYGKLKQILFEMASRVSTPEPWIEGIISLEVPEMSLRPFLSRLDSAGFERQTRKLLSHASYRWEISLEIFRRGDAGLPGEEASAVLEGDLVRLRSDLGNDWELLRSFVSSPACDFTVETPLQWILASAIAGDPHFKGEPLQRAAQETILATPALPLLPPGVWAMNCSDFGEDPAFATEWLIAFSGIPNDFQLAAGASWHFLTREISQLIAFHLSWENKRSILQSASLLFIEFFAIPLVARDSSHYRVLAERGANESALLLPLAGFRPEPEWVSFAKIALEHGIAPERVAQHAIEIGMGGSSAEIESWIAFLREIRAENPDLALVISTSLDLARQQLARVLARQRQVEMSGLAAGS